ncbi:hypothetical protein EJ02DRAFT_450754 [Clathrospora elynae]|uniref:Uncharacterized protein n=1 Tax=Clathrospora elynae TaxID=706981 RepID=A0A6A5T018_9PLEO|nr:hypothetical protein EJ02DRAFT_450754 [Clathrospora elynae]
MGAPLYPSNMPSVKRNERTTSDMGSSETTIKNAVPQLDGPTDHRFQMRPSTTMNGLMQPAASQSHPQHHHHNQQARNTTSAPSAPPPPPRQQVRATGNAVNDLLPYCTTEPPLSQARVIALSDVVGSLKELALLSLGASSGDTGCAERLQNAVGQQTTTNIVEFFVDEWEIEG